MVVKGNFIVRLAENKKTSPCEKAGFVLNGLLNRLFVTDGECHTATGAFHISWRNLKFYCEIAAFLGNKIIEFYAFVRLVGEQQVVICVVNGEFHYVRKTLTKVENPVALL